MATAEAKVGAERSSYQLELDKLKDGEKAASKKFTQDDMIAAANRIIKPYSLDVKEIVWWSIYDIGHSITDKFDDVPEGSDRAPRVFTAGDACHTHSPKAGQGMNVSMQDTFNLGWKLVHVLQGRADPSLLRSYSKERLTEARRLVETDHEWARIMSAPTTQAEREGTEEPRIIRPLNYAKGAPGRGARVFEATGGRRILVAQALGQVFMELREAFLEVERLGGAQHLRHAQLQFRPVQRPTLFPRPGWRRRGGRTRHLDGRQLAEGGV